LRKERTDQDLEKVLQDDAGKEKRRRMEERKDGILTRLLPFELGRRVQSFCGRVTGYSRWR
jgi:hypothetical protein